MTSHSRSTVGLTDVAMLLELLNASEESEELYDSQLREAPDLLESALSELESIKPELTELEPTELEPTELEPTVLESTEREWIGENFAERPYRPLAAATDPNLFTPDDVENPFAAHIVRGMSKMKPG
jgi:hypothetical protein